MSRKGYRVDCHTHLWRYPGELTDELARETFIMRNQEVDLDITPGNAHGSRGRGGLRYRVRAAGHR